ncbi:MAG: hypothetical protein K2M98_07770 [Muribaculum sp.]|nr:hypothetical protein [Muribaculum sp.]
MKRKIKLTEKDLKLNIKSEGFTSRDHFVPNYDTNKDCPQSVYDPECEGYTRASCLCANNTRNCTETITRRDIELCAETYVSDCNIPVTDKSYAVACTVDGCQKTLEQCEEPGTFVLSLCGPCEETDDCAVSDECGETFPCPASIDGCDVKSQLYTCESTNVMCETARC